MKNSFASQLMLYMSAQNELSQKATDNVSEIKSGCSLDEMCVYIMLDQIKNQKSEDPSSRDTQHFRLPPGATQQQFAIPGQSMGLDKATTNPEVFGRILELAKGHFNSFPQDIKPQQKILVLWGHGGGLVMLDEEQELGVRRAQANIGEFADVLKKKSKETDPLIFDIVAFDSCYMCMIETMHQLRTCTQFALCSSTMVDASGFPYTAIVSELKTNGKSLNPQKATERIAELYRDHYIELFPDGNRFLFICKMDKIAACVDCLNEFGVNLSSLIATDAEDDPVRDAVREALIGANADSSYVYILRFLKMLAITLSGRISEPQLKTNSQFSERLNAAVMVTFSGNIGDTTDRPISPMVWAPLLPNSFLANEAGYNLLEANQKGTAGWTSFWRKFHRKANLTIQPEGDSIAIEIGMPTTKQLAL